ncbi:MAG: 16S rRNA (guanine(527)-N(7))-methyltransferase RsmG [Denitrovibrio sp.]|nr:MAG: 16S rRNA (guanine(527)-N(7))-methyltransferase RsmG [Denitrovibrio sp.]
MIIKDYYDFTDKKLDLIEKFYQIHLNATLNLTRIKDREDFYRKHVLDSFLLFTKHEKILQGRVADIGTGGGFPGVILAIMYPELKFSLIDSVAKKCKFLEDAVAELGLENVEVITSRCENIRNRKFETILSRGVAKVDQMINFTIKLADKDCIWVLYKGQQVRDELFDAKVSLINKKLEYINVRYETPIQRTYTIINRSGDAGRLR